MYLNLILLSLCIYQGSSDPTSLDRVTQMPDFMQTSVPSNLPGGGAVYCGPAAVSNGLVWLAKNGHPELLLEGSTPLGQEALIAKLGEDQFMKTNQKNGTSPDRLMKGLAAFLKGQGCTNFQLEAQGWVPLPPSFSTGNKQISLTWLQAKLDGPNAVWASVAWFKEVGDSDLARIGGHYFTIVGLGKDEAGQPSEGMLAFLDSSERGGSARKVHYARITEMGPGQLVAFKDWYAPELPRAAQGTYGLVGGYPKKEEATHCVIQCIITLNVDPVP